MELVLSFASTLTHSRLRRSIKSNHASHFGIYRLDFASVERGNKPEASRHGDVLRPVGDDIAALLFRRV